MKKYYIYKKAKITCIAISLCYIIYAQDMNNIKHMTEGGGSLGKSKNNIDVININKTNQNGVSYNKYQNFDVGKNNGVILNNSIKDIQTQRGGDIKANPNLGIEADLIINEIVGTKANNINGFVEVGGKRSALIFANENGINLDGAEFINTTGITFTTGKIDQNNPYSINVEKSGISIGKDGVSADGNYFNIISKVISIAGKIKANDDAKMNLIAGSNNVNLNKDGKYSITSSKKGNNKDIKYSIDASNLGSMYAGDISIISTESGIGVRHDGVINTLNTLNIQSENLLNTGLINANNISINSNIENDGSIIANNDIYIKGDYVNNNAYFTKNLSFADGGELGTLSTMNAGHTAFTHWQYLGFLKKINVISDATLKQANIQAGGKIDFDLNGNGKLTNKGQITAQKDIQINGNLENISMRQEMKAIDYLNAVTLTRQFEGQEYIGNLKASYSGRYFNAGDSLYKALQDITKRYGNNVWYDKEGLYKAIVDVKNEDSTISNYLALLLGDNYATLNQVPNESSWNKDAVGVYIPDSSALISSNGDIKIKGGFVNKAQELSSTRNKIFQDKGGNAVIKATNLLVESDSDSINEGKINVSNKINWNAKNILNIGGEVTAQKADLNAENVQLQQDSSIKVDDNLNINAKNDVDISNSNLLGLNDDSVINITALSGNVNIKNDTITSFDYNQEKLKNGLQTYTEEKEEIKGSKISAGSVNINAKNEINVTASTLEANNKDGILSLIADKINIEDKLSHKKTINTKLVRGISSSTKMLELNNYAKEILESYISNPSSLKSKNNILLAAASTLELKASNIQAENIAKILSKEVNISTSSSKSLVDKKEENLQILGYNNTKTKVDAQFANISSLKAGLIDISAQDKIDIVGSNLEAAEVKLYAKLINLIAAQNTINTSNEQISLGIVASAQAGLAGQGASASFNTATMKGEVDTAAGSNIENIQKYAADDVMTNASIALELAHTIEEIKEIKYANSLIKAADINMIASDTIDFGGADIAGGNINLDSGDIKTTKYKNKVDIKTQQEGIYIKQNVNTTSSIATIVNQAYQNIANADAGKNINGGIVAAQLGANIINIMFNDLVGANSTQMIGFSVASSKSQNTNENTTNIKADNLKIQSTKGDIELNGVIANANNIELNSAGDTKIKAANYTSNTESFNIAGNVKFNQRAGVTMLDGGETTIGSGGGVSIGGSKFSSNGYINSVLNAKNYAKVSSNNLSLQGANILANDILLDIQKDVLVESMVDKVDSINAGLSIGMSLAMGLSSAHIFTGDGTVVFGLNASKENSNLVNTQSSIIANNTIDGLINNDVRLKGGILGSSSSKGDLKIGGDVFKESIAVNQNSSGANINMNIGTSSFENNIEIDDIINKKGIVSSAINVGGYSDDIKNTINIKDNSYAGGSLGFEFSVNDAKELINKIKNSKTYSYDLTKNIEIPSGTYKTLDNDDEGNFFIKASLSEYENDGDKKHFEDYTNKGYSPEFQAILQSFQYDYRGDDGKELELGELRTALEYLAKDGINSVYEGRYGTTPRTKYGGQTNLHEEVLQTIGKNYFTAAHESKYQDLISNFYSSVAKDILTNKEFYNKLEEYNKDISSLYYLTHLIDNAFTKNMKEILHISYPSVSFGIKNSDLFTAYYTPDIDGVFFSEGHVKRLDSSEAVVAIFHELTHRTQSALVKNKDNDVLSKEGIKEYIDLISYNNYNYSHPRNFDDIIQMYVYKNQSVEIEAFQNQETMETVLQMLSDGESINKRFTKSLLKNPEKIFRELRFVAGSGDPEKTRRESGYHSDSDSESDYDNSDSDTESVFSSDSDSDDDSDDD